MDINSINNDRFVNRKRTDSIERNRPAEKTYDSGNASKSVGGTDRLDLSTAVKNDLDVGRAALRNMDMSMLDRVREIRTNIKNGAYNTDEVYRNITNALIGEFQATEASELSESASQAEQSSAFSASDLESLQQRLANSNDSIVSEIAGRLLGDL